MRSVNKSSVQISLLTCQRSHESAVKTWLIRTGLSDFASAAVEHYKEGKDSGDSHDTTS